jgi:hypothetical protein
MTTPNILELAKQGNTQAITILMNKALETKEITVQISITDRSMTIVGESLANIEQSFFVNYVRQTIKKLKLSTVKTVYIRGKITDSKNPIWTQIIDLEDEILVQNDAQNGQSNFVSQLNNSQGFNILIQFREIINTIFLGGILGILFFNLFWEQQPKTVEWEYKTESFEDAMFDSSINRIGQQGWELVFARRALTGGDYSRRGIYECIFKRPKQKSNEK